MNISKQYCSRCGEDLHIWQPQEVTGLGEAAHAECPKKMNAVDKLRHFIKRRKNSKHDDSLVISIDEARQLIALIEPKVEPRPKTLVEIFAEEETTT